MSSVPSGLAATLGAGIFAGLAPAVAAAGTWVLAALVLAALLAIACGLSGPDTGLLGWLGRVAGMSAVAATFGSYVLPEHPLAAAAGLIVVAVLVDGSGFRPSGTVVRWAVAVVLAALGVFVAACLAIAPPGVPVPPPAGSSGTDDLAGLPVATMLMFFGFLGFEPAGGRARGRAVTMMTIGAALVVYLAVAAAALRQLGGPRLALSPDPLRAALAAADASAVEPVLVAGVAVASLSVALGLAAGLRGAGLPAGQVPARAFAVAGGAAGVAGAALLTVPALLAAAAGLMFAQYLLAGLRSWLHRHQRQD